jgi:hypothetical protein
MSGRILVSTAYLPPVEYFSVIAGSGSVAIEKNENYIKQTYRNRCCILSSHGIQILTVPVLMATVHKVLIDKVKIDYSKRWQQVHLRAMMAAYRSSPYFDFYFDRIEKIISEDHELLFNLNTKLLEALLEMLRMKKEFTFSDDFEPPVNDQQDFRYTIVPGREPAVPSKKYLQVFDTGNGFAGNLSILDLIFNTGPEASQYL